MGYRGRGSVTRRTSRLGSISHAAARCRTPQNGRVVMCDVRRLWYRGNMARAWIRRVRMPFVLGCATVVWLSVRMSTARAEATEKKCATCTVSYYDQRHSGSIDVYSMTNTTHVLKLKTTSTATRTVVLRIWRQAFVAHQKLCEL